MIPKIHIINITHEVSDCLFFIEYKVNGHIRTIRATKYEIANYVAVNNDANRDGALKLFSDIIKDIDKKTNLFTSYLTYFHTI